MAESRILISDLVVDNLFTHSLPGMILLYLATLFHTKGVLHEIAMYLPKTTYFYTVAL